MHLWMSECAKQTPAIMQKHLRVSVQMHLRARVQMHAQASLKIHARAGVWMHAWAFPPMPKLVTAPTPPLTAPALPQHYPCSSVSNYWSLLVSRPGLATLSEALSVSWSVCLWWSSWKRAFPISLSTAVVCICVCNGVECPCQPVRHDIVNL